jgi:hypothetical protein
MLLAAILGVAAAAHAAIPDVSGTWTERQILSEFAVLPLVGEVPRTSTTILRVTVEQSASALVLRATYCASSIDNGSPLAATTIPDAFLVSLGEIVIAASIDESGQFVQPWATEVRGARLAAPETDPLPTRADDPRVIDQDGDGKPGLTVHVSALGFISGDVYVVQRIRTRCIGVLVALGRIQGTFECTSEQVVLSATSSIFESELPSRPNPEMDKSTFVLVRIDPSWSCAKVLAERANLFGR